MACTVESLWWCLGQVCAFRTIYEVGWDSPAVYFRYCGASRKIFLILELDSVALRYGEHYV
jgi:hypothetical protein